MIQPPFNSSCVALQCETGTAYTAPSFCGGGIVIQMDGFLLYSTTKSLTGLNGNKVCECVWQCETMNFRDISKRVSV